MGVKGENLKGVYGGNELLEHRNFPELTGKTVCVIGGGNVAIDCSRTLKKLGAENVNVIYRRAEEQMPAEKKRNRRGKTRRNTIFISKQYCRNKRKTKSRKIRINKNRINSKRRRKQTSTSKCRK